MIKAVVFDVAGTVVDEHNIVYKTVQKAIQNAGLEVDFETVLKFAAGKAKLDAIKDVLIHLERGTILADSIYQEFKAILKKAYETEPIEEQSSAMVVFEILKNNDIKVVLNTGYDRATAKQLMVRLGWQDHPNIDLVITASDVERGRPHPDMIHLAMEKLEINAASEIAKIGDSIVDVEEGFNAGCAYSIGITTGAHTKSQLAKANPSATVERLTDLLPIIGIHQW